MFKVVRFTSSTWKTWTDFQSPSFSLAQTWLLQALGKWTSKRSLSVSAFQKIREIQPNYSNNLRMPDSIMYIWEWRQGLCKNRHALISHCLSKRNHTGTLGEYSPSITQFPFLHDLSTDIDRQQLSVRWRNWGWESAQRQQRCFTFNLVLHSVTRSPSQKQQHPLTWELH